MSVIRGPGFDPKQAIEVNDRQVAFQVTLYTDGYLDWKSPVIEGDPSMSELVLRGMLDKTTEAIKDAIKRGGPAPKPRMNGR